MPPGMEVVYALQGYPVAYPAGGVSIPRAAHTAATSLTGQEEQTKVGRGADAAVTAACMFIKVQLLVNKTNRLI